MLVHSTDKEPGISRKGAGTGFYYVGPDNRKVTDEAILDRIRSLAIPPAYKDVWICTLEDGHLQVTGRDDRQRKQYIYHPEWHQIQKLEKFDRQIEVGNGLPSLRRKVRRDLSGESGEKMQVIAAAVRMIDKAGFRVGNETYLEKNGTRGVSTLAKKNVSVSESTNRISVKFNAKGGREVTTDFSDELLNEVLKDCHELPGQRLFRYQNERGNLISVHSGHINDYLGEAFDNDVTAKDLRTWRATAAVVEFLRGIKTPSDREAEILEAIRFAAEEIQNRYATCRKHYVHPGVLEAYRKSGRWGISRLQPPEMAEMRESERLLLRLLG